MWMSWTSAFVYLLLSVSLVLSRDIKDGARTKRSIVGFKQIVTMMTGRNAFDFNGYGNYCGYGGGGIPIDPIDECCYEHDMCYASEINAGCRHVYTAPYIWGVINQEFVCMDPNPCHQETCMCDLMAAQCFARTQIFFNPTHKTLFGKITDSLAGLLNVLI